MKSDMNLATKAEHGKKKDKAGISACLTCNATGTDRLPIWFIGKAKGLACSRNKNLQGLQLIRALWRYSKKA